MRVANQPDMYKIAPMRLQGVDAESKVAAAAEALA